MENVMRTAPGILSIEVGYAGGTVVPVRYEQVETGKTGHAEAVRIVFDPDKISYRDLLLHYYFRCKERLSGAVLRQVASRIFPALMQTLSADISLDEKIDRLVTIYLDNLLQNLFVPGYLISELHHDPARVRQLIAAAIGTDPANMAPLLFRNLERQIRERVREGTMRPIEPQQFIINLISLCVFPFAARPMLSIVFGMDEPAFARFIQQRKKDLPVFFRNALRP
jgi:AcrR family transcriptional regulator